MLLHSALRRLAADLPKTSTHDLPQLAHLVRRSLRAHNGLSLPIARALSSVYRSSLIESRRSYATTKTTKTTGTAKKAAPKKAAPKKTAAKKTAVKKKTAAKKPAKKTVKKTVKKAPTKKPKRVKKELTPEEKEKANIKVLRAKALKEPVSRIPLTGWVVFATESRAGSNSPSSMADAREIFRDSAAKWKNLSPAEREHYNRLANEKTAARLAEYQAWIRSYTPAQIKAANLARRTLRHKLAGKVKGFPAHTAKLVDDRQLKRPAMPMVRYFAERSAAGDFKGIAAPEAVKLASIEWKAMSESEKKKYEDVHKAEIAEYNIKFEQTYGSKPRQTRKSGL